ncbi:MAG: YcaQ family DNA glycosylase [Anaerolineales bacterium]|nr:YcaQ family DNA glycosylase [Anaerolineales bacterium]
MPKSIHINKTQARRFVLNHLHLLLPRKLSGAQGVYDFIRKVNCIQYDPINVVGQNPHLVLQSRVRDYQPAMLDALLYKERKLVDGFDKQMAIYPSEDWPDFAYYRSRMAKTYMEAASTAPAVKLVEPVRQAIEERGPLSSLEFEDKTKMDWWLAGSARAARIAMDILFYRGDTVVHHRVGTRRYFDLSERVLPAKLAKALRPQASQDEYMEWHVLRRAGGIGLLHSKTSMEYGGLVGWQGGRVKAALQRLAEKGHLVQIFIEGLNRLKYYVRPQDLPALHAAAKAPKGKLGAALIAPLDNLMWNRGLVRELFDFDYIWEVYVPEPKRKHGYYVLPVLYGDRLVARMDPEFDRQSKVFRVKNWWWQNGVDKKDEAILSAIQECLAAFARYLKAQGIELGPAVKGEPGLKRAVAAAGKGN